MRKSNATQMNQYCRTNVIIPLAGVIDRRANSGGSRWMATRCFARHVHSVSCYEASVHSYLPLGPPLTNHARSLLRARRVRSMRLTCPFLLSISHQQQHLHIRCWVSSLEKKTSPLLLLCITTPQNFMKAALAPYKVNWERRLSVCLSVCVMKLRLPTNGTN
jgi:hypothetical protein